MKTEIRLPLGLPEFKILKQSIYDTHIVLEVAAQAEPERCSLCGFKTIERHDRRPPRKVRDLDLLDKQLMLLVHVRRYFCRSCGEVFSESFDSIPSWKHQTCRFRDEVYRRCQDTTISAVSRQMNASYKTVERIYYAIAQDKMVHVPPSPVIGIDEIAVRKGHRYETVITDTLTGKVHGMNANRDTSSVKQLLGTLSGDHIQTVVMDMWKPFYKAVSSCLPQASVVIDKYHVVQKVNHAMDAVRKSCAPSVKSLKKGRFALLKRRMRLTPKQALKLDAYHEHSESLAYAYYLKEWFYDLYQQESFKSGKDFLDNWIMEAEKSPFSAFHEVAKTLKTWEVHILEYFRAPYTNARTEGTNHKIKTRKRMAYGYRNLEHFRIRVQLDCMGSVPSSPQDRVADSA